MCRARRAEAGPRAAKFWAMRHTHADDGAIVFDYTNELNGGAPTRGRSQREAALRRAHDLCGHEAFVVLERAAYYFAVLPVLRAEQEAWRAATRLRKDVRECRRTIVAAQETVAAAGGFAKSPWEQPPVVAHALRTAFEAAQRAVDGLLEVVSVAFGAASQVTETAGEVGRVVARRLERRMGSAAAESWVPKKTDGVAGFVRLAFYVAGAESRSLLAGVRPSAWREFGVGIGLSPVRSEGLARKNDIRAWGTDVRREKRRLGVQ